MKSTLLASLLAGLLHCSFAFAGNIPGIHGHVFDESSVIVAGAEVMLYIDDGDGILGASDEKSKSTFTGQDGQYRFDDLNPDNSYFVMVENQSSELQSIGDVSSVIDTFDITQSVIATPISVSRMDSTVGPSSIMVGGHRDMYMQIDGGVAEGKLRVNPYSLNSNLQIDMSAGVTGMASITWDGVAGISGITPDHGLDMDFSEEGKYEGIALRLAVDAAGEGQMLSLVIHSAKGLQSVAELEFPVVPDVTPSTLKFVPFTDFVGDADITKVSAFQLIVDAAMPSLDAQIDMIGLAGPNQVDFVVIPAPTGGLLALLGFVVSLAYRRRRPTRT